MDDLRVDLETKVDPDEAAPPRPLSLLNTNEHGVLEEVLLGTPTASVGTQCPNLSCFRGLVRSRVKCGPSCGQSDDVIRAAFREMDAYARALRREGVVVHQIEASGIDAFLSEQHAYKGRTIAHRYNVANPRDSLLSFGRNIVVASMGKIESRDEPAFFVDHFLRKWCRRNAFRLVYPAGEGARCDLPVGEAEVKRACKRSGLTGTVATFSRRRFLGLGPRMPDHTYCAIQNVLERRRWARWRQKPTFLTTNSARPLFEAADFCKLDGGAVVGIQSAVTNASGFGALATALTSLDGAPPATVWRATHAVGHFMDVPWHLDTTLVPVASDKVLLADRKMVDRATLKFLHSRGVRSFPQPPSPVDDSFWHLNLLSLGHGKVCCDGSAALQPFRERLRSIGLKPIPLSMAACREAYAGAFHCTTLDLKRRP